MHDLLGDDYGRDPIPARILRVCKSTAERSFLHSLGALLAIKEWKEDFKQFCFVSQELEKKNTCLKNAMREKLKKPTTCKAIEARHNIGDEKSHGREPDEQNAEKDEVMPKEDTFGKVAEDSRQEPENLSEEENSSGMWSVYSTRKQRLFVLMGIQRFIRLTITPKWLLIRISIWKLITY